MLCKIEFQIMNEIVAGLIKLLVTVGDSCLSYSFNCNSNTNPYSSYTFASKVL